MSGDKHLVVWHNTENLEPPEDADHEVGLMAALVPPGALGVVDCRYINNVSSLAVKVRFQIAGHPVATLWAPIPPSMQGSFIRAAIIHVADAPDGQLQVTILMRYWDAATDATVQSDPIVQTVP